MKVQITLANGTAVEVRRTGAATDTDQAVFEVLLVEDPMTGVTLRLPKAALRAIAKQLDELDE